jgi:hypothetical protein
MKKSVFALFIFSAIFLVSAGTIFGQKADPNAEYDKYVALLRKDLRSEKKQIIAMNLVLTDAEATKFWPIYDKYAAELTKIYDKRLALIKEYADNYDNLTNATAASLNQRSTAVDQSLVTLRLKYLPLVAKVLPGKKAALFFQLDKRIGLLVDLQLASEIPLVEQ